MWCSNCRQDLPAIANGDMARCMQCGRFLKRHEGEGESIMAPHAVEPVRASIGSPGQINVRSIDDDWMLEQQMAQLRRTLSIPSPACEPPAKPRKAAAGRIWGFAAWMMLWLG